MNIEVRATSVSLTIPTRPSSPEIPALNRQPLIVEDNTSFNGLSRDEFRQNLDRFSAKREPKKVLVYDPAFDEKLYEQFWTLSAPEQQRLEAYTKRQIETYIGERVNVISSTTRCEIVDGKIIPRGLDEPMEDIIQRGIEFRRKHGNPIDFEREDAELTGFRKTQVRLTDSETPIGTMILSVSSPGEEGSDYKRSFNDGYVLKQDATGARYVEITRFLSSPGAKEYQDKLAPYKVFNSPQTVVDFLRDPIEIDNFSGTPQELQEYLRGDIKALGVEELAMINKILAPTISLYSNSLKHDPHNLRVHRLMFNAILNKVDIALDAMRNSDQGLIRRLHYSSAFASQTVIRREAEILGAQPVRDADVPCPGSSGGLDVSNPFSVSAFGLSPDQYGARTFECPDCHRTNVRPKDQLLSECQHCGSKKVCAPTEESKVNKKAA
jgi:hypothetical protein